MPSVGQPSASPTADRLDAVRELRDEHVASARVGTRSARRSPRARGGRLSCLLMCSSFGRMPTPHYNFADLFELPSTRCPIGSRSIDKRRQVTYRELDERCNRLAHTLAAMGVQAGDHVGILATNCIEWVEAMFAIYKMRASVVNVNFRYVEEELRYLFENSDLVGVRLPAGVRPARRRGPRCAAQAAALHPHRVGRHRRRRLARSTPIEFEAAIAVGLARARLRRTLRRRHLPALHRRHDRHAEGRDVAPGRRVLRARAAASTCSPTSSVTSPTDASEKIDPAQPQGLVSLIIPPLMHGAGQMTVYRTLFEGNTAVIPSRVRCRGDLAARRAVPRQRDRRHRRRDGAPARRRAREDARTRSTCRRSCRSRAPRRSSRRRSRNSCRRCCPTTS